MVLRSDRSNSLALACALTAKDILGRDAVLRYLFSNVCNHCRQFGDTCCLGFLLKLRELFL
ncbi:hypothetical protein WT77_30255 [Burkholderia stagnalis]|nr:hypothetical protein WT77_30255 [Burkholderia stagnalis]